MVRLDCRSETDGSDPNCDSPSDDANHCGGTHCASLTAAQPLPEMGIAERSPCPGCASSCTQRIPAVVSRVMLTPAGNPASRLDASAISPRASSRATSWAADTSVTRLL